MREITAFIRQDFLTATSYRVSTIISLGALVVTAIPVYFIANALQPVMGSSIRGEGDEYFAFVLVGLVAYRFVSASVSSLPAAVGSGIRTGTLEALFATPTGLPKVVAGMIAYEVLWVMAESVVLLVMGIVLGAHFAVGHSATALFILGLIVLSYLPFGILGAALYMVFRTTGTLLSWVIGASILLGGVYYPTHVIPSWLENVSAFVPLTYGLRALRRTVLEDLPIQAVAGDIGILAVFVVILLAASTEAFRRAVKYARRAGTLAQY